MNPKLNIEYFRNVAKQTTKEEMAAGWIYVGQSPIVKGLQDFVGISLWNRSEMYIYTDPANILGKLYGNSTCHYFMKISDWEEKIWFMPQTQKRNSSTGN